MKSDNILAALNDIDPELIEDAEGQHKPSPGRCRSPLWLSRSSKPTASLGTLGNPSDCSR